MPPNRFLQCYGHKTGSRTRPGYYSDALVSNASSYNHITPTPERYINPRLASVGIAGEVYSRCIDDAQYLVEYNEILGTYQRKSRQDWQETILPCDGDFLVGLPHTSIYEALLSAPYLSGPAGWWDGKGLYTLMDVQDDLR